MITFSLVQGQEPDQCSYGKHSEGIRKVDFVSSPGLDRAPFTFDADEEISTYL